MENHRPKILFPPGMGDCYWTLTKLEDFIKQNDLGKPIIYSWSANTIERAHHYLDRFSFLEFGGHDNVFSQDDKERKLRECLKSPECPDILADFRDYDYLMWFNGSLEDGQSLETDIMPEYHTNWYPEMTFSEEEVAFGEWARNEHGDFMVVFWLEAGMYKHWTKHLTPQRMLSVLKQIKKARPNMSFILSGVEHQRKTQQAILDLDQKQNTKDRLLIDMIGRTNHNELCGLIKASKGMIGMCAGNTILSVTLGNPTFMFWSDFFKEEFSKAALPPDSLDEWYFPYQTQRMSDTEVIKNVLERV